MLLLSKVAVVGELAEFFWFDEVTEASSNGIPKSGEVCNGTGDVALCWMRCKVPVSIDAIAPSRSCQVVEILCVYYRATQMYDVEDQYEMKPQHLAWLWQVSSTEART